MTRAVQQVLRTGSDNSPLNRRILRELHGTRRTAGAAPDRGQLAVQVARRLCAVVLAGLQRGGPAVQVDKETVLDL
jgi:hypothetical protein